MMLFNSPVTATVNNEHTPSLPMNQPGGKIIKMSIIKEIKTILISQQQQNSPLNSGKRLHQEKPF